MARGKEIGAGIGPPFWSATGGGNRGSLADRFPPSSEEELKKKPTY